MLHLYAPKYRPPSFVTVPAGWVLVERPGEPALGFARRKDLPVSQHPFGVIGYRTRLTPQDVERYQLTELGTA